MLGEYTNDGKLSSRSLLPNAATNGYLEMVAACDLGGSYSPLVGTPTGELVQADGCSVFKMVGDAGWK